MKKIIAVLLILPFIFSCILYSTPPLGETNFPLKQAANVSIEAAIEEIAVGDSWIAIRIHGGIIALDIDTLKRLWTLDAHVSIFGEGFQMVDDMLVAASKEQIFLIDRQGQKSEIDLRPRKAEINIIRIATVYTDYLYVFRGDNWTLEAYDISNNEFLWEIYPGRPGIIYDPPTGIAYVLKSDVISAVDNQSGKTLWEQRRQKKTILPNNFTLGVLKATLDADVLYVYERTRDRDYYRITAIDVKTQKELWMKEFVFSVTSSVTNLTVIDDLLLANGGNGLIALNKFDGKQAWETSGTGEDLFSEPIKLNGVIYVMGGASKTVFAISADDGSVIGTVNLEGDDSYGGIYGIKDGILVNTSNSVVIYKAK